MANYQDLKPRVNEGYKKWYGERAREKPLVVVCIPAYNEEKAIASVIMGAQKHAGLVLVGDDGSTDNTAEIARKMGAEVLSNPRNMGKGSVLNMLINYAYELRPDALVTIDGDGQHDPEEIPRLAQPILQKEADLVVGSRYVDGASTDAPQYRRFGLRVINAMTKPETGPGGVKDTQSGFRAYSSRALGVVSWCESVGFGIDAEQLVKAAQHKLRIVEVPITVRYNGVGKTSTKGPMGHGMELIGSAIKLVAEDRPLLMLGVPGMVLIGASIVLGIDLLTAFNETRYFSIPKALLMGFAVTGGFTLIISSLLLYAISRINRKIERKTHE